MNRTVNREVLEGFIDEAKSYLPTILKAIEAFRTDPTNLNAMEEAHRLVHTIKGASAMVGLAGLSHIGYTVEETLEEMAAGQVPLTQDSAALLRRTIAVIREYLDATWNGTLDERPLITSVVVAFRRLHGLPEAEDDAAVRKILSDVVKQTSPMPPAPAAKTTAPAPGGASAPRPTGPAKSVAPPPPSTEQDLVSPELLEAFATEAEDHLRQISTNLAELEKRPDEKTLLQEIRRSVHTLKGAAGAVGLKTVAQLAHRMEDLLDQLYEGGTAFSPDTLPLLFGSADALEDLVRGGYDTGAMQSTLQDLYIRYAARLAEGERAPSPEGAAPETGNAVVEPLGDQALIDLADLKPAIRESQPEPAARGGPRTSGQVVRAPIERLDELVRLVSELAISRTTFEQRMTDFGRMAEDLRASAERLRRVSTNLETQYEASTLGGGGSGWLPVTGGPVSQFSRNTASEFDALEFDRYTEFHRLSRELTETTTDIRTIGGELTTLVGDFDGILLRQGRLSSELQDKLMRVRMVPLATLATRLHRTVRTVARDQGKLIDLVLKGEHIELDKTMLEEMADPLLHLLRNAVDHGIEPPALRQVMGKPERGTIVLQAFHEGNQVVIQVSDDGAGLEPQLLRAAAVSGGYVSETDAPQLSDDELYSLIFIPGFSTSTQVSEVSGRGVGLDIVKNNVHKLKGTIAVDSKPGQGVTFTVRLPMTLAVMRALMVKANNELFAIPQSAVAQILRMERSEIQRVGQEPVVRVAGRVYPILRLGEALKLKQPADESATRVPVLIVNAGSQQIALVVDELISGREIVIKTLGNHLRRVHGITGATLMGDGTVVLILNPVDLVSEPAKAEPRPWTPVHSPAAKAAPHRAWSVMIVDDSVSVRRVVSNLIRSVGWQPVAAKDGLEALEMIQRSAQPPDLLLLDIEMPRMDGFELMSTLKGQATYRHIPIVMLTSRAGEKHQHKALELGASEYVVKPYQDENLVSIIKRLILESKATTA